MEGASLFHLSDHVGPALGGSIAYFISTFVFYWWHRARHECDFLWRFHQIHHSAQRIEVITSFYKHPVEMSVNSIIGAALVYGLLGLSESPAHVTVDCGFDGDREQRLGDMLRLPDVHRD